MSARGKKVASPPETPEIAASLARFGWPVFPVTIYEAADGKRDKVPAVKWKAEATTDVSTVNRWWAGEFSGCWIGVYAEKAGIVTIDLDVRGDVNGFDSLRRADLELPNSLNYGSIGGGTHVVCAAPEGIELTIGAAILGPDGEKLPGVDIRSGSGLMVYYGPAFTDPPKLAPAPDWALVRREKTHRAGGDTDRAPDADVSAYLARCVPGKPEKAVKAACADVAFPEGDSHGVMLETVAALVGLGSRGAKGVPAALEKTRERYVAGRADRARDWDNALAGSVKRLGLPPVTIPLTKAERQALKAPRTPARSKDSNVTESTGSPRQKKGDDAALAAAVAEHYRSTLIRAASAWWKWNGTHWAPVTEDHAVELVRSLLKEWAVALVGIDNDLVAWYTRKATIDGAARLIRGILERDADDFDAHSDELNTPSGIVDLRTGDVRPCDPERMHTKITGAAYVAGAKHPDWDEALTALPPKVCQWMQVRFGQAATGHTPDDDLLPINQGKGANGKTTIQGGVQNALGTYAVTVPEKLLLGANEHPTVLMELRGSRLAVSEELPEGHSLSVSRMKRIVGTTRMKARAMRQDYVEWTPTHSLMVSSNYEPRIPETDHGTWRRLALVRFPYRFVDDPQHADERKADRRLRGRLEAGKAGRSEAVLAWIVEGARRWYAAGMQTPEPPRRVVDDTAEWRERNDEAFAFIEDRLVFGPDEHIATADLTHAVKTWLIETGRAPSRTEEVEARVREHDLFRDRGVRKARRRLPGAGRPNIFVGVGLRPVEPVLDSYLATTHH